MTTVRAWAGLAIGLLGCAPRTPSWMAVTLTEPAPFQARWAMDGISPAWTGTIDDDQWWFHIASTMADDDPDTAMRAPVSLYVTTPKEDAVVAADGAALSFRMPGVSVRCWAPQAWASGTVHWVKPLPSYHIQVDAQCGETHLMGDLEGAF